MNSAAPTVTEFRARFPQLVADGGLPDVAPLLRALVPVAVEPGAEIITYRARSDQLYLVWRGRLRVWIEAASTPSLARGPRLGPAGDSGDRHLTLGELGPGKWVGEATLLDHGPATATVTAIEPSQLLALSREAFDRLRAAHAPLAARLIQALSRDLAKRLRHAQIGLIEGPERRVGTREWGEHAGRRLIGAEGR
jgi:CRP-like cAMP-binding protein